LGSDEFIERHSGQANEIKEIPRAQLKAIKPPLERILAKNRETGIADAYREHGYPRPPLGSFNHAFRICYSVGLRYQPTVA
jgi:hypothetical protein